MLDADTTNKRTASGHTNQTCQRQQRHIACSLCQQLDGIWLSPWSTNMLSSQANHNAHTDAYICDSFVCMLLSPKKVPLLYACFEVHMMPLRATDS